MELQSLVEKPDPSTPPSEAHMLLLQKGWSAGGHGCEATLRNPTLETVFCMMEPKVVLWDNLEGPDGEEGGSGVQEGGDIWDAFLSLSSLSLSFSLYIYIPRGFPR